MTVSLTDKDAILARILRRLPHYYKREYDASRNSHRLLQAVAEQLADLGQACESVRKDWSLFNATGHKLDILGERFGIYRGLDEADDDFRTRLTTEVLIETSHGHVGEIKNILGRVLSIPPEEIAVYLNYSPSLGIGIEEGIDSFMEIEIPLVYLEEGAEEDIFMFADDAVVPDFDSDYGFDYGRLLFAPTLDISVDIDAILERIVAAGVGFTVSGRGGFMFSDWPTVPNFDDDDGFDAGRLSGILL